MTTEELLKQGKDKLKELQEGLNMLTTAQAAREVLEMVSNASISIFVTTGTSGSSVCLNDLWEYDKEDLKKIVERQIERQITRGKTLLASTGCFSEVKEALPKVEDPEPVEVSEPKPLETDAAIPDRLEKARVKHTVDRKQLADMYFKQGKGCIQIARETGLAESTVFRHIADMKAEKEQAAKECVRH